MLTYTSARALGGLKGAIANRTEAVFASLPTTAASETSVNPASAMTIQKSKLVNSKYDRAGTK